MSHSRLKLRENGGRSTSQWAEKSGSSLLHGYVDKTAIGKVVMQTDLITLDIVRMPCRNVLNQDSRNMSPWHEGKFQVQSCVHAFPNLNTWGYVGALRIHTLKQGCDDGEIFVTGCTEISHLTTFRVAYADRLTNMRTFPFQWSTAHCGLFY